MTPPTESFQAGWQRLAALAGLSSHALSKGTSMISTYDHDLRIRCVEQALRLPGVGDPVAEAQRIYAFVTVGTLALYTGTAGDKVPLMGGADAD